MTANNSNQARRQQIVETIILLLLAAVFAGILNMFGLFDRPSYEVSVRVESPVGGALIGLQAPAEAIPEAVWMETPWEVDFTARAGDEIILEATNSTGSGGGPTCQILINGEVWVVTGPEPEQVSVTCAVALPRSLPSTPMPTPTITIESP